MFATSLGLLLWFVVLHILLPWIAGILFVWLVFGRNRTGIILHCLARLVGVGVIANWLFDLQFLRFGVGAGEYMLLVGVLVVALGIKIFLKKDSLKNYLATLRIERSWTAIKDAYVASSRTEQVLTWLAGGLSLVFLATSFVFTTHLPTYADDSFGNRHRPVINILHDGGVHMFGNEDVILARGRLGYPIHIPLYNALVADMA